MWSEYPKISRKSFFEYLQTPEFIYQQNIWNLSNKTFLGNLSKNWALPLSPTN